MRILFIVFALFLLSPLTFASSYTEVKCVDGPTVQETQNRINSLIRSMYGEPKISAPAMTLKHSGVENPYVICVTATFE